MSRTEQRREYARTYYQRNKEAIAAKRKARLAARTPEQIERDKRAQSLINSRNYRENRCKILEIKKRHREKYSEEYRAKAKAKRASAKEKPYDHLKKYGINKDDYLQMLEQQGGVCAICGKQDSVRLAVDHCHTTGAVRGLLCAGCNTSLGRFNDDVNLLRKAVEYLEKSNGCIANTVNS